MYQTTWLVNDSHFLGKNKCLKLFRVDRKGQTRQVWRFKIKHDKPFAFFALVVLVYQLFSDINQRTGRKMAVSRKTFR